MSFKQKLTSFLRIACVVVLLISALSLYIYLHRPTTLPIERVQIVGSSYDYLDKTLLQDLITPYVKTGFFSVQLVGLQQALLQLPWLEAVQVRRIWPYTLVIVLTPRTPVARWGEAAFLDENAVIFVPEKTDTLPKDLPQFEADISEAKVLLKTYQEMNKILEPLRLVIVSIKLNGREAWVVTLTNGIVLYLGRDKLLERMQRFVNTYPQILLNQPNKVAQIVSVDLRYENGLAIQWKKTK